ncbi:unnamed protein product [Paramecium pentaurelia]|uniref:Cation-transporting ATPase n=1 Tax=Paramecium pentaurelia TaxID=43138 RepID=A0A8S1V1L2_9CILI|nr:unnamed protein product [Paramecium pentaurelia]
MKVKPFEEQLLCDVDFYQVQFIMPKFIQEEGIIKQIVPYKSPSWKQIIYWFFCFISIGLAYLFSRWEQKFNIWLKFQKCLLEEATHLLIYSALDEIELVRIEEKQIQKNEKQLKMKIFSYRLYSYFLEDGVFKPIETSFYKLQHKDIIKQFCKGLTNPQEIAQLYGYNNTTIPDKSTIKILIDEVLSPFYLFQAFSVTLWLIESYTYYAIVILLSSLISIIISLRETKNNFKRLREMSAQNTTENLFRKQNAIRIENESLIIPYDLISMKEKYNSNEIVPGDLIEVQNDWTVPCDCILLNGSAIVNESMLTGESIPIIKTQLPYNSNMYNPQEDSKTFTLYAGTKCIEARHPEKGKIPVLALATQTGFSTIKGELVRSILYPKPVTFSFYKDSLLFLVVLAIMAFIGWLIALPNTIEGIKNGEMTIFWFIINSFDLVTITVPPALPTCLSIGVSFALARLQKKKIYCISPNKVNVAGKITIMCFDKTGTLTEDGLDLYGVRAIGYSEKKQKLKFDDLIINISDLNVQEKLLDDSNVAFNELKRTPKQVLFEIMASCHSLATVKNNLIGDPLEIKMFEATQYKLDDINSQVYSQEGSQIKILKRFEFSSTLQRMSVIIEKDGELKAYVKGSPEKLRELCKKQSVPSSFHKILDFYSKLGFRILACGAKTLTKETNRDDVESNLTFIGLLIMQNKLKSATKKIIQTLQDGFIRTIMVTGDNVLTAISVARQCSIVQPNQRIFLGDIGEEKINGKNQIVWKDFDMSENVLNPENLSPELDIQDDPDNQEDENDIIWNQLSMKEKQSLENALNEDMNQIIEQEDLEDYHQTSYDRKSISRRSQQLQKSKIQSYKDKEKQLILENLDHLIDDQDPWKTNEPFVIAISGKAFQLLTKQIDTNPAARKVFGKLLERAQIFARMKPEQKAQLITHLQKISKKALCGMCGDGANDCGALKAADVGISLSEAEASIAAPFTSKIQDISCVVKLLREGRASLVTSFQCFKYMALYSMIQFITCTLLYLILAKISDFQFLYIDLVLIIPLAFTMGKTKAYKQLTQFQPGSNLLSFPVLMSVIGQTIIQLSFQCIVYFTLRTQNWYVSNFVIHEGNTNDHYAMMINYENTSLFLYSSFQYIFQCIAFSIGKPFRREFYTNLGFTSVLVILFVINFYVFFFSQHPQFLADDIFKLIFTFQDSQMPQKWLIAMFILMIINMIITILFEKYAVPITTRYYRAKKRQIVKRYRFPENPYLRD